jgi:DNA-binding LacI/PurR family transcriptional regulator
MVINDRSGTHYAIGEETRQRVWAAVEELAYVTNPAARALAGGRSQVLGIFTFEPVFPVDFRDFYYPFLLGIEEEAEQQGYDLMLFTSRTGPDRQRRIFHDGTNRLRVTDGCVLLGRGGNRTELQRLISEPFPVVFVGRRDLPISQHSYVGADYATATAQLVDHLADMGHTKMAYLGWPDTKEPTIDRRRGYDDAHARRGWAVDPQLARHLADHEITRDLVADLRRHGATAVLAQDDLIAERVLAHAHDLALSVPEDLSIVVLGDPPRGGLSVRDWTGFTIPREEMGRQALRALVEVLDAEDEQPLPQMLLPCTLRPGSTTGPAGG